MITKKLMHDIITFCNNYLNNDNIVINISKYATYLYINFGVWVLDKNKYIDKNIGSTTKYIHSEADFNKFKETIKDELSLLLVQLNTK